MPQKLPDEWFRPPASHDDDPTVVSGNGEEQDTIAHSWQSSDLRSSFPETREATPSATPTVPPPGRTRPRSLIVAAVVVAVVLAGVTGVFLGQWLFGGLDRTDPGETSLASAAPSLPVPWDGPLQPIAPSGVEASCTAPAAKDSTGQQVTYEAALVVDGRPETAWRCPGDGVGETLTFTFPVGAKIAGVRMSNGYTKTDPTTEENLYAQYRRILAVRWQMPDGSYFAQTFSDNGAGQQEIRVPATDASGTVTLTIEQTTDPGVSEASRDAVLISEITFLTPA